MQTVHEADSSIVYQLHIQAPTRWERSTYPAPSCWCPSLAHRRSRGLPQPTGRASGDHPGGILRPSSDHPGGILRPSSDHPGGILRPSSDHPAGILQPSWTPRSSFSSSLRTRYVSRPLPRTLFGTRRLVAGITYKESSSRHPSASPLASTSPPAAAAYCLEASSRTSRDASSRLFQTGIRRKQAPLRDVVSPTALCSSLSTGFLPALYSGQQSAPRSRSHSGRPPSGIQGPSTNFRKKMSTIFEPQSQYSAKTI
jgi:hypothetical protein